MEYPSAALFIPPAASAETAAIATAIATAVAAATLSAVLSAHPQHAIAQQNSASGGR